MDGNFDGGKSEFITVLGVGFLVLSLATAVVVTTNPNLKQLIGSNAANTSYTPVPSAPPLTNANSGIPADLQNFCASGCAKTSIALLPGTQTAGRIGYAYPNSTDVAGFYISNDKYYPIAAKSGGPTTADIAGLQQKIAAQIAQNPSQQPQTSTSPKSPQPATPQPLTAITDAQCGGGMIAEGTVCRNPKTGTIIMYSDIVLYNVAIGNYSSSLTAADKKVVTNFCKTITQSACTDPVTLQKFAIDQLKIDAAATVGGGSNIDASLTKFSGNALDVVYVKAITGNSNSNSLEVLKQSDPNLYNQAVTQINNTAAAAKALTDSNNTAFSNIAAGTATPAQIAAVTKLCTDAHVPYSCIVPANLEQFSLQKLQGTSLYQSAQDAYNVNLAKKTPVQTPASELSSTLRTAPPTTPKASPKTLPPSNSPSTNPQTFVDKVKSLIAQGAKLVGPVTTQTVTQVEKQQDGPFITDTTTINRDLLGNVTDANTKQTTAKTTSTFTNTPGGLVRTDTTTTYDLNGHALKTTTSTNQVTTNSISDVIHNAINPTAPVSGPTTLPTPSLASAIKPNGSTCSTDSDCGSGYCGSTKGRAARSLCTENPGYVDIMMGQVPNYAGCQNLTSGSNSVAVTEACRYKTYVEQSTINNLTFGQFDNYVQTQQALNSQYGTAITPQRILNVPNLQASTGLGLAVTGDVAIVTMPALAATGAFAASAPVLIRGSTILFSGIVGGELANAIASGRDIVQSTYDNAVATLSGGGYYSPILNTRITYKNGKWYRVDTGAEVNISNVDYLNSNVVPGLMIQHSTVNQSTFESPAWKNLATTIATNTSSNPNDITAITDTIYSNLTYNYMAEAPVIGGQIYQSYNHSLQNILANNQETCFEFAVTEQAYLANKGISTKMGSGFVDIDGAFGGHAFLQLQDKNGQNWILDPTNDLVMKQEDYVKLFNVHLLKFDQPIYSFANNNNASNFSVSSNGPQVNGPAPSFLSPVGNFITNFIQQTKHPLSSPLPGSTPNYTYPSNP